MWHIPSYRVDQMEYLERMEDGRMRPTDVQSFNNVRLLDMVYYVRRPDGTNEVDEIMFDALAAMSGAYGVEYQRNPPEAVLLFSDQPLQVYERIGEELLATTIEDLNRWNDTHPHAIIVNGAGDIMTREDYIIMSTDPMIINVSVTSERPMTHVIFDF